MTLDQLTDAVCAEFDVDATTCLADLQRFLDDLLANGIVKPA